MDQRLEIQSPAKVNLCLHVCGERADGYHEIESLMCPVSLCDDVVLELGGEGVRLECKAPGVPEDETNLAWKAAALFFQKVGERLGVHVELHKRIPAGAGLGGGSSNAASVLTGLNELTGRPLTREVLAELGARLGSDIPFFVYGGPAWVTGVGEKITPVSGLFPHHLVIVHPGFEASTARVYKKCNLALTRRQKLHTVPVLTGDPACVEGLLHNDLEAPAVQEYPGISDVRNALEKTGADHVLMTGSGSSVFALFRRESHAEKVRARVSGEHGPWRVFSCRMLV